MSEQYFHFTIGPVQAFVAQARRTRDFWAGSFLLSWMASVAMKSVASQGGEIEFPQPDTAYLKWLEGEGEGLPPQQGSIPNRFKAARARVPESFDPQQVTQDIQAAWAALAEQVWQMDLSRLPDTFQQPARTVWDRQVGHFWEISWCLSPERNATNLLDRRKNWRTYCPPAEPGVSCMMMEGWQELSGQIRPGREVNRFWQQLTQHAGKGIDKDLRSGETLCAIAFIKRRFARIFEQLDLELGSSEKGQAWSLRGWALPLNVPSVNYMAAAPWLARVIDQARDDNDLHESLRLMDYDLSGLESRPSREGHNLNLKRIEDACAKANIGNWHTVNGRYFYQDELSLMQARTESAEDQELLKSVQRHLHRIEAKAGHRPSDFYAILLMDGDSLGSQMSDGRKQTGISNALNRFTRDVPEIVRQHSGFLVYAGGDDVLALLSVDDSLACAEALRNHYNACFEQVNQPLHSDPIQTSLSGALLFCHYKSPLTQNLGKAHPLLDEIAKERTGRNSLAIAVWKPGGLHCQWSSPWEREDGVYCAPLLQRLAADLMSYQAEDGQFSRKFMFKLEQLVEQLGLNRIAEQPEQGPDDFQVDSLIRAAWAHTGKKVDTLDPQLLDNLLKLVRQWRHDDNRRPIQAGSLSVAALKLLHFLSSEQIGISGVNDQGRQASE